MRHAAATMLGFALSVGLMFPVEQAKAEDVLKAYAHQPDLAYAWRVRASEPLFGGQLTELIVTSQRWKDTLWKHQVFVYRPDGVAADADSALLVIGGGTWRDRYEQPRDRPLAQRLPREAALVARSAKQLGGLLIVVKQVPFQPIFGNRREDAAIAYSFKQALEREDPSWPLLLPMVKSVVRTMDAVSEYAGETWETNLRRFTLTGASKRGWTTYLTGAVDDRVMAIAPMVFDILHFEPQLSHQRKAWGDYSRNIGDYTELQLHKRVESPAGQMLLDIVDPFRYRHRLTMPKLIVLGTNDAYWPLDAMNLYWADLSGPKSALYVPNAGHGLGQPGHVVSAVIALHRHALGRIPWPSMQWDFEQDEADGSLRLTLTARDPEPTAVNAWLAHSESRDFRKARWRVSPVAADADGTYRYRLPSPDTGYAAVFAEAVYDDAGRSYSLTSQVRIIPDTLPQEDAE